jgi:NAD(P)-dependent dehydrogenase (short-subunit alcohol dehydrogenase family)
MLGERCWALDGSPGNILFLNAGISRPADFNSVDEAFFEDHIAINVKGPFFVFQQMMGLLKLNASVVITTSCLDEMGRPGMSVYAATKATLRSLVRSLGAELIERGIRINAVARSILAFTRRWEFT